MLKLIFLITIISMLGESKMVMVGNYRTVNLSDVQQRNKIEELANYAVVRLTELENARRLKENPNEKNTLNYTLIKVESATSQVVAGVNYRIKLKIREFGCSKNCIVQTCDITVYERLWENFKNLTEYNCKTQQRLLGGKRIIPNDDKDALNALKFGIKVLNERSNNLYMHELIGLDKAIQQIVNGFKYELEFRVGKSSCMKNQMTASENCLTNKDAKEITCTATILDQPWISGIRYKLMNSDCKF
jgi:hypothetical protein